LAASAAGAGLALVHVPLLIAIALPSLIGVLILIVVVRRLAPTPEETQRLLRWTLGSFVAHLLLGLVMTKTRILFIAGSDTDTYHFGAISILDHWRHGLPLRELSSGKEGYFYVLAWLYRFVGPFEDAGLALNAVLAAALVPIVTDSTRRLFGNDAARYPAPLVTAVPAFLIWTSPLLREASILFLMALAVNAAMRLSERISVTAALMLSISLGTLFTFRANVALIVTGGLVVGIALGRRQLVGGLGAGISVLGLILTLVLGAGLGYSGYQASTSADLTKVQIARNDLSTSADSGFAPEADVGTTSRALTFLPLGLIAFLLGPFPWQLTSVRQVVLMPDTLIWWWLLPSLWRGLRIGYRTLGRRITVVVLPAALTSGVLAILIGNFGTILRERTMVVLLLVPLVALGLAHRPNRGQQKALAQAPEAPPTEAQPPELIIEPTAAESTMARMSTGEATQPSSQIALRDYLEVVWRRKLIIVLAIIVVTATAIAASVTRTKVYEARAEVLLETRVAESIFLEQNPKQTSLQTEIRVLKSAPVAELVRERLGVAPGVSAAAIPLTDLFQVSARSTDPESAAVIANAYARAYIDYRRTQAVDDLLAAGGEVRKQIDALQRQIDELSDQINTVARNTPAQQTLLSRRDTLVSQQSILKQRLDQVQADASLRSGGAQLVTPAVASNIPVEPTPRRDAVLGGMVGLVLGLAIAFLFEHMDDTVKGKEDFDKATPGFPVLGMIPNVASWKRRDDAIVVSTMDPTSPAAEAYRTLRTSISFLGVDRPMRTLQVTSASAGDGKSTTLANLAVALARAGVKVIVVGCDLRRPRIHEFFGLSNEVGFTSVLVGDVPLSRAIQVVPDESNLRLLASGPLPPNPSELLSSQRTYEVLVALQAEADIVLLDCPPVLPVTDAAVLSSRVDATLLVASARKTTKRHLSRAVELLRQVGAPLVGAVLNNISQGEQYGGYSYAVYRPEDESPKRRKRPAVKV
jgi:capsular exopolysaccharide synthesis family protein